jgi:hypothetical protein
MTEAVPKLNGVHADSDDEVRISVSNPYSCDTDPDPAF